MWQIKYWYHIIEWYAVLPKYTHNSYIPLGSPNFEAIFMKRDTREAGKYTDKIESYLSNNELRLVQITSNGIQISLRCWFHSSSIFLNYVAILQMVT